MGGELTNKLLELASLKLEVKKREAELELAGIISTCKTPYPTISNQETYGLISKYHTDMVSIHSIDGNYLFATDSCHQFGWSVEDLIGSNFYNFIHKDDKQTIANSQMDYVRKKLDISTITYRMQCKDGSFRWVETRSKAHKNSSGIESIISVTRDVSKVKAIELNLLEVNKKLREMTVVDELTGIPNYRAYREKINQFMYDYTRGDDFALVVIDIDHFKKVNDTYGHETGNCVIREIAQMLYENIRQSDFVCRFGGEEFVLLLKDVNEKIATSICEDFRKEIETKIICGINVTASFGVAVYNDESYSSSEDLIKKADTAMYESKANGRNKVTLYKLANIAVA
jgi:diguanylate cyclase (GGDEF)-like protein/PAS domain S-box-containing protein